MSESMIRLDCRRDFTVLQNGMLRDRRLSLKTKGLFAVMLSRPGTWQFSVSGLAVYTGAGRDAIRGALKELREAGYLTIEKQSHGEHGKFAGSVYILHEESKSPCTENPATVEEDPPQPGFPSTAEPSTGEPSTGNPTQVNTDIAKTEESKIPPKAPQGGQASVSSKRRRRAVKSVPDWKPERFEGFWAFYPLKKDRVSAAAEWDRLQPPDELIDVMAKALGAQKASEQWQKGIGIPYACRWLKHRRWEDVVSTEPEPTGPPGEGGWDFA